jgi:hypothetical protein
MHHHLQGQANHLAEKADSVCSFVSFVFSLTSEFTGAARLYRAASGGMMGSAQRATGR